MCPIDNAHKMLTAQICAAERLLRSLPGSSHSNCFVDVTEKLGCDVVAILRLSTCPASGVLRICVSYFDDDVPIGTVAVADVGIRSMMIVGPHVTQLIDKARNMNPDIAVAAQQLAADIESAMRADSADPRHARPTRSNKSELQSRRSSLSGGYVKV